MTPRKPWAVSARAVRSWQAILLRQPQVLRELPAHFEVDVSAASDYDRARKWLLAEVQNVRDSYARNAEKRPQQRLGHPNLYAYRGGLPLRLRLLVDAEAGEVVDVLGVDGARSDGARRSAEAERRRRRGRRDGE